MTIIFDFGGVLVKLDKQRCIDAFEKLGFNLTPFIGTYAQAGILSRIERGEAEISEFCEEIRKVSGLPLKDSDICEAWASFLTEVPHERIEMLRRIRKNYPLCVLSNTNEIHWGLAENKYFVQPGERIEDLFSHVFLSYKMGVEKPEKEIFERVINTLQQPADSLLFLDDSEENCKAARKSGLRSLIAPADGSWMNYFDEEGKLKPEFEAKSMEV